MVESFGRPKPAAPPAVNPLPPPATALNVALVPVLDPAAMERIAADIRASIAEAVALGFQDGLAALRESTGEDEDDDDGT